MKKILEQYSVALTLLDNYDHQSIPRPISRGVEHSPISYDECLELVTAMGYTKDSTLFGNQKDNALIASINSLYQTVMGAEVYPTLEEKSAHLLYFVIKNHAFSDGNKRIATAIFLYYLDKNNALIINGKKRIDDHTLATLVLLIAHSEPQDKEQMISLILSILFFNNIS